MTFEARRTLAVIRKCVDEERYALTVHFSERMVQRGLFWSDVQTAIDDAHEIRSNGIDTYGRPKWILCGEAATGDKIEIVCAVEVDDSGTEFITIYWDD